MEKQFSVDELAVGMFVSGLDRPWLDTPFLVQGFLIEDEQTLAQLRQTCRKVTVDLRRSAVNDADHVAPPRKPPATVEAKVGRVISPPADARKPPRSLFPRWLQEMFAGRGYTEPEVEKKPSRTHQRGDSRPSSVKSVNRLVVGRLQDVTPSVTALERRQGIALGPRKDLLAWLREQLERVRFSAAEEPSAADGSGLSQASRLKRGGHGPTVYHNVPLEQELQRADDSFGAAIDMLGAVMHDIRVGKGLQIEAVESVVEDLVESIIRHPGALQLVSRMREADESSYTHALQVAVLLASFGRELVLARATDLPRPGRHVTRRREIADR